MLKEWINVHDVIRGILTLMQHGRKLPEEAINAVRSVRTKFPNGTPGQTISNAERAEMERQITLLAESWLKVLVPAPKYRTGMILDKELWELTINEALKLNDVYRRLDISVVAQGLTMAEKIKTAADKKEALERQMAINAEWRKMSDDFSNDAKYRNKILVHWTNSRLAVGAMKFNFPCIWTGPNADASKKMLLCHALQKYPGVAPEIIAENIMLLGMQHCNEEYCRNCIGWQCCYMQGHQLMLDYDANNNRFIVTSKSEVCPKYVAEKISAQAAERK